MKVAEGVNRVFRNFSMYKGISFGLSAIWIVAFALSFVGLIGFSPWALLVSMLVLVGSTYIASVLCGLLFGVSSHAESSYITGLILAFLFTPSLEVTQLVIFAFIGFIAGASKFVVTWRGRHVFNPAAFAAVVITLTGLAAASWWVATPVLTPIVLLVVLISLYQTKRYGVVGIFLGITAPVLVITFLAFGLTFFESLALLLSWPILFLAGILLTEPLTLPPRKWQMYIVAAVTAIAFLLPLEIGPVQMSPALALLIGNIVAAFFAARHAMTLKFKDRTALTPTTDELTFTTSTSFSYQAGQYAELWVPHKKSDFRGFRRSFSITSSPTDKEVTFGIKFYAPSSSFKKTLKAMEQGYTLRVTNIAGDFVLPKNKDKPLLFVAGGIGITPFISHLQWLKAVGETRDITVVYAVSSDEEIAYRKLLAEVGIRVVIVSTSKPAELPKGWLYLEGARINFDALNTLLGDTDKRWAYVSGPVPFVQTAKRALKKQGVQGVKTDYFSGY